MGWAALVLFVIGCALFWMACSDNARLTSADERLGAAIFAVLGAACLGLAFLLWMAWVSFR
ncbi:hypothetical protein MetexDRAFT_0204 [Methylorubrum extorquens DSM 13060]|uniref:Uncharacterized protein n=1 Tax=Methylorubrum extorquens DSM 13060 TaxID=882800 RepID=H1KC42_METEX|nr:hypothetical protein MetexDRAFT_0204 [Methylorubrum extorquens DSM 13060]